MSAPQWDEQRLPKWVQSRLAHLRDQVRMLSKQLEDRADFESPVTVMAHVVAEDGSSSFDYVPVRDTAYHFKLEVRGRPYKHDARVRVHRRSIDGRPDCLHITSDFGALHVRPQAANCADIFVEAL